MIETRIEELKDIEKETASMIKDAEKKAEEIRSTIHDARREITEKAGREAKKEADSIRSKAVLVAQKKERISRETLQEDIKKHEKTLRGNFDRGINFLKDWLFDKWLPKQLQE